MLAFLGILSGLVFIIGDLPYISDILKGKTKPHRISWLIFFILNVIFLGNQLALGARASLWLVSSWTLVTLIVAVLSIRHGVGGLSRLDLTCLVGAILGLILWAIFRTPLVSVYCNLLVSAVAYIPTIKKAYLSPHTETKISWFTASLAAVLSGISVGSLNYRLLLLPCFSVLATATVFIILVARSQSDV